MERVSLTPFKEMQLLKLNTKGDTRKVVSNFMAAGLAQPQATLTAIWDELHRRFGASAKITSRLMKNLAAFPPM